jgi:TPP-dependent pyruvate/acetoin dehydrogenase alpha subunit
MRDAPGSARSPMIDLAPDVIESLWASMWRIRRIEEEVARIYPSDKIKSPVHLSIGQEAVAAGVCQALKPQDIVFGTYRGHATYLAKGGDLGGFMAELYGKVTGCARGKGGSMHLIDPAHGVMGTSAVVATTIPHAVGYAYAMKLKKKDVVTVSVFGDGAVEEGAFHESLNFAAVHKLPVIFVCENNLYAIHSPLATRQPADNIFERPKSFGVESIRVEMNDVVDIYRQTLNFAERIRRTGAGPYFMECRTYRWRQHVGPAEDFQSGYRSKEECSNWVESDQIPRLEKHIPADKVAALKGQMEAELARAIAFADESPFPDDEELHLHLYRE